MVYCIRKMICVRLIDFNCTSRHVKKFIACEQKGLGHLQAHAWQAQGLRDLKNAHRQLKEAGTQEDWSKKLTSPPFTCLN